MASLVATADLTRTTPAHDVRTGRCFQLWIDFVVKGGLLGRGGATLAVVSIGSGCGARTGRLAGIDKDWFMVPVETNAEMYGSTSPGKALRDARRRGCRALTSGAGR